MAPDQVRSLALVSAYTFQRLTWWERLAGLVAPSIVRSLGARGIGALVRLGPSSDRGRRMTVLTSGDLARQIVRHRVPRMAATFADARSFYSRPWLTELRVPTLIIVGGADRIVSSEQSRLLAAGIPGPRLRRLPGAGPMLPLSHLEGFAGIVAGWFPRSMDKRRSGRGRRSV